MIKKNVLSVVLFLFVAFLYSQNKSEKTSGFSHEVIYKIVNEDTLKLQIFNPEKFKKRKKYSTMVFFFGGGWNGGSITQFESQANYFAARGMVTVLVDYRVKSRQNTTPFDAVEDAKSAMRFLRLNSKKYGINPKKMVASGGSAGGHLAAATSLITGLNDKNDDLTVSSKANALVLYNPVIDNSEEGYGYDRIGERYLEISPMHNITKGAPPTLFLLGSKDVLIPASTAYEYKAKMEAKGSRCDVIIYEGQGHGFFNQWKKEGPKYYNETTKEADIFLESIGFLKGKPTI